MDQTIIHDESEYKEEAVPSERLKEYIQVRMDALEESLYGGESEDEEEAASLVNELIRKGKKYATGVCQWSVHGESTFSPSPSVIKSVPAGVYKVQYSQQLGYYLAKQKVVLSDELLDLPVHEIREIVGDIEQFWHPDTKQKFIEYDMTYKRGIIVFGPPGNGKSMMMQLIIKNLIEKREGIILTLDTVAAVENFIAFAGTFRQVEPKRPLVVIMEDIDNVVEAGHNILSALMNILDGVNQIDNVVYLATTNYPEKLQERISNRPSRFDRKYEIGYPNKDVRMAYIKGKMKPEDQKKQDIDKWATDTEGFSLSHIKELIVSVCILDKKFEDVMEHFAEMKRVKSGRTSSNIGYSKKSGI